MVVVVFVVCGVLCGVVVVAAAFVVVVVVVIVVAVVVAVVVVVVVVVAMFVVIVVSSRSLSYSYVRSLPYFWSPTPAHPRLHGLDPTLPPLFPPFLYPPSLPTAIPPNPFLLFIEAIVDFLSGPPPLLSHHLINQSDYQFNYHPIN